MSLSSVKKTFGAPTAAPTVANTQLVNAQNRLQSVGVNTATPEPKNFLLSALEMLSRPGQGANSMIREVTNPMAGSTPQVFDPFKAFYRGLSGQEETMGKDVMSDLGLSTTKGIFGGQGGLGNPTPAGTAGLLLDIFNPLDPLNWIGLGAGDDIVKGASKGTQALTDAFGSQGSKIADLLRAVTKSTPDAVKAIDDIGANTVGDLIKQITTKFNPGETEELSRLITEGLNETGLKEFSKLDYKAMKPIQIGLQNPLTIGNSGMSMKLPGYEATGGKLKLPILYPGKDIAGTFVNIPGSEYLTNIVGNISEKVFNTKVGQTLGKWFSTAFVPNNVPNSVVKRSLTAENLAGLVEIYKTHPQNIPLDLQELMNLSDDLSKVEIPSTFNFMLGKSPNQLRGSQAGKYLSVDNIMKQAGINNLSTEQMVKLLGETPFEKNIVDIYSVLKTMDATGNDKKLFEQAARVRKVMDMMYEQIPEGMKPMFSGIVKPVDVSDYPKDISTSRLGSRVSTSPNLAYVFDYKGVPVSLVINSGEGFNLDSWIKLGKTFDELGALPEDAIQVIRGGIDISPVPLKNPDTSMAIGDNIVLGRVDKYAVPHEWGHVLDNSSGDVSQYSKSILSDSQKINDVITSNDLYSDYSRSLFDSDNTLGLREDLADSIADYIQDRDAFLIANPSRGKYIEELIAQNKITPEQLSEILTNQENLSKRISSIPRAEEELKKLIESVDQYATKIAWEPGDRAYTAFRKNLASMFETTDWKERELKEQIGALFDTLTEAERKQIMDVAAQISGTEIPGRKVVAQTMFASDLTPSEGQTKLFRLSHSTEDLSKQGPSRYGTFYTESLDDLDGWKGELLDSWIENTGFNKEKRYYTYDLKVTENLFNNLDIKDWDDGELQKKVYRKLIKAGFDPVEWVTKNTDLKALEGSGIEEALTYFRETFEDGYITLNEVLDMMKEVNIPQEKAAKFLGGKAFRSSLNDEFGNEVFILGSLSPSKSVAHALPADTDWNNTLISETIKPMFSKQDFPIFMSKLEEVTNKMPNKMKKEDFIKFLRNNSVKDEEIKWTFLDDFLRDQEVVTKADVQEWIVGNKLKVQEVWKGNFGDTQTAFDVMSQKIDFEELSSKTEIPVTRLRGALREWVDRYGDDEAVAVAEYLDDINEEYVYDIITPVFEQAYHQANLSEVDMTSLGSPKFGRVPYVLGGGDDQTELIFTLPLGFNKATQVNPMLRQPLKPWYNEQIRIHNSATGEILEGSGKAVEGAILEGIASDYFDPARLEIKFSNNGRWESFEEVWEKAPVKTFKDIDEEIKSLSWELGKAMDEVPPEALWDDDYLPLNRDDELAIERWKDIGSQIKELQSLREIAKITGIGSPTFRYEPHWDEDNPLAHARFNTRYTEDGRKILFVEEIQSDWHQQGRDRGYKSSAPERLKKLQEKAAQARTKFDQLRDQIKQPIATSQTLIEAQERFVKANKAAKDLETNIKRGRTLPDAPFKDNWDELVQKRILRYASDNGFDGIAWTTGTQQAKRWSQLLGEKVDTLVYNSTTKSLQGFKNGKSSFYQDNVASIDLKDYVGEEIANQLRTEPNYRVMKVEGIKPDIQEPRTISEIRLTSEKDFAYVIVDQNGNRLPGNYHKRDYAEKALNDLYAAGQDKRVVSGTNISVGGQGMKSFYDQQVTANFRNLGKKFGLSIDEIDLTDPDLLIKDIRYSYDGEDYGYLAPADRFITDNLSEGDYEDAMDFIAQLNAGGPKFSSDEDVNKLISAAMDYDRQDQPGLFRDQERQERWRELKQELLANVDTETRTPDYYHRIDDFESSPNQFPGKQPIVWLDPNSRQKIRSQSFPLFAKQEGQLPEDTLTAGWSDKQVNALDNFLKWRNSVAKNYLGQGIPINELEKYVPFIPTRALSKSEAATLKTVYGTGIKQADNMDSLMSELSNIDPNLKTRTTKATRPQEINKLLKREWLTEDAAVAMSIRGTRAIKAQEFSRFADEFIKTYGIKMDELGVISKGVIPDGYKAYKVGSDAAGTKVFQPLSNLAGAAEEGTDVFFLPEEMVTLYNEYSDLAFNKEKQNAVLQVYDSLNRTFKKAAYLWNPGHIARDFQGNVFNNYLMGVKSPADYADGLKVIRQADGFLNTPKGQLPYKEVYENAHKLGIIDSEMAHEIPSVSGKTEDAYSKLMRKATYATDGWTRSTGFVYNLKQGMSYEQAAAVTKKFLFDYFDLTSFERKVMKRVVPFYTWLRKNIPLQLEVLVKNPRLFARFDDIRNSIAGEDIDWKSKPGYVQDSMAVQPQGSDKYIGMSLPMDDLTKLPVGADMDALGNLLSSVSPLIRAPLESITNQDWWTGDPLEDYAGQQQDIPLLTTLIEMLTGKSPSVDARVTGNILGNIPILERSGNLLDSVIGKDPSETRKLSRISTTLGGPSMYNADSVQRTADWEEKERLLALIQRLQDSGMEIPTTDEIKKNTSTSSYQRIKKLLA